MFSMPNTHIYVNMMDYFDSDYCSNDYVDIDEHLESWEQQLKSLLWANCDIWEVLDAKY